MKHLPFSPILLLSTTFILALFFVFPVQQKKNKNSQNVVPQKIVQITQTLDQKQQIKLYRELIEQVGPVDAQEELYKSGLPFDGQTHLLNHTVGDWLYDRYGESGLTFCKDYFLSSCYHGFVIRAIAHGGLSSLQPVMQTCWDIGRTTAVQCAHAIGHGLLAYDGYKKLPQALEECDKVSTLSQGFPTYNCWDGVFMENVWAVHDGKPSPDQWISQTDNLYPCNSPQIPEKYKQACWANQPSRMYILFQGDISKIGKVCLGLTNKAYQETCFDALARQIHPVTQGSVDKTFSYCSLLPKDWVNSCITSIVKAAFSVGDRNEPYQICERIEESAKNMCYSHLSGIIKSYASNQVEKKKWCSQIKDTQGKNSCLNY